jgi:hypothetical protein
MTSAQDLGDLFCSLCNNVAAGGLYKDNIDAVAGAAPDQPGLCGGERNEHLIIFTAERAAAFRFQHANDTEWLSFDPNGFTCNPISMTKKILPPQAQQTTEER